MLLLVVGAGILLVYVKAALPNVGEAVELKIDYTSERLQRGEYLANAVSSCMDCHSTRDWSKFSGPPKQGTLGMGGDRFDQSVGMPGVFFATRVLCNVCVLRVWTVRRFTDTCVLRTQSACTQ